MDGLQPLDPQRRSFAERIRRIEERRRGPAGSQRRAGWRLTAAWRGVVMLTAVFFLLKAMLIAHLGQETYRLRLERLAAEREVASRLGARVLAPDPVSLWLALRLAPWLKEAQELARRYARV